MRLVPWRAPGAWTGAEEEALDAVEGSAAI